MLPKELCNSREILFRGICKPFYFLRMSYASKRHYVIIIDGYICFLG